MANTSATATTPDSNPNTDDDRGDSPTDIQYHHEIFTGFVRTLSWSATVAIVVLIFVALVNA